MRRFACGKGFPRSLEAISPPLGKNVKPANMVLTTAPKNAPGLGRNQLPIFASRWRRRASASRWGHLIDAAAGPGEEPTRNKMRFLFLALFFILLVGWIFGFVLFHVAGALIHLLLILAVVALVIHLLRGR
jgi:Family of unknown function (DUF5670)